MATIKFLQDVEIDGDVYVDGGKIYMGTNTSPMFDNSATDSFLLIGDTALDDSVQDIKLNTFGTTQVQVGDGEIFFFGAIEAEGSINVSQSSDLHIGDGSKITFQNDSKLQLDTNIVTNNESNGITITTASTTTTAGLVYALRFSLASPIWTGVDATTDSSTKLLAVATGTNATDGMLTMGVVRKASHGFTVGLPLYIHPTSSGQLSNTAPTGSGEYVRVCGYAIDADHYYFNPDGTWVQIV